MTPTFAERVARAKSTSPDGRLSSTARAELMRHGLAVGLTTDDAVLLLTEVPARHPATSIAE